MTYSVFFLGSSRCFHTIDWYESALGYCEEVYFITDMIEGEGFECLVKDKKQLIELFVIDRFLSRNYGGFGHILRNFIKILCIPIQVWLLRRRVLRVENHIIFAHSTYYAFLAALAGLRYVSTPQGSEVLVRLRNSKVYKAFASLAHRNAMLVTVDSESMKERLASELGVVAKVVQNGVNARSLVERSQNAVSSRSDSLVSIRGVAENYRILEILLEKKSNVDSPSLVICCPFSDRDYLCEVEAHLLGEDCTLLGKLSRAEFHDLLLRSNVVISVPISDSSPRSVYEAIFAGCVVIATENGYLRNLPSSMSQRIVEVDLSEANWLTKAYGSALEKSKLPYMPCEDSISTYEQATSFNRVMTHVKSLK